MKSKNKILLWISGITGSVMALNAGSLQFTTNTIDTRTTVVINCTDDDGSVKKEEVVLNKTGSNWVLVRKNLQNETHFNLAQPTLAKFVIDGLTLQLTPTLDLTLSGTYDGDMCIDHPNKVLIAKGQTLTVSENFFLNKAILFENQGNLMVDKNWLCLLTAVKNSGTITIKQGWQVMSLQTFENATSGKFTMQQTDILSPGTKITNKGQINCVLDFNGAPCDFTNHAGEVRIGGNATLKSFVNKSETEPKIEILPNKINPLYKGSAGHGSIRETVKESRLTVLPGKKSDFMIQKDLNVEIGNNSFSDLFVGQQLKITSSFQIKSICCKREKYSEIYYHQYVPGASKPWYKGGGHYFYWKNSWNKNPKQPKPEILATLTTTIQVLGTVTGKVETLVNGKADKAQPGVVKATQAALAQHKAKLEQIAQDADILPMLADPEVYAAELQELKANPVFATMVRLQEKRKLTSATNSTMPSRRGSPGLN